MLHVRLKNNGKLLEVIEIQLSATKKKITYWYYDLSSWMRNANGKENEAPSLVMNPEQVEWVKKNYFPKVGLTP